MAVIIGAGTTVGGDFSGACAISVNWGYNPNTQRLYCLGSFVPHDSIDKPTETLSITIYSGANITYSTAADQACVVSNVIDASVSPAGCDWDGDDLTGDWFVTSYGFSKDDPLTVGQETWGMQRWVASGDTPEPSYVIRGIAEGQATPIDDATIDADPGVLFSGTTTESQTGSVSANAIGRADKLTIGVVIQVGGSEYPAAGKTGQGSVSIPYTPLWV